MGKWCLHASLFMFDRIIIKVTRTGIKTWSSSILGWVRLLILELLALEWRKSHIFELEISLKPVGQSWSNFMCSNIGVGERLHKILGQIGWKLWFPWQQNPPPHSYNGENDVSTISRLFLIRSFLYLQIMRTCIKSRTSSNFGQIGPLTTELAALEV